MGALLDLEALTESWRFSLRHIVVLAPVFIAFGLLNNLIQSLSGSGEAQQAAMFQQLSATGNPGDLAALNAAVGSSQNPGLSLIAIGLLFLAFAFESVLLLGMVRALSRGEALTVRGIARFTRHRFGASIRGFTTGFLRFILLSVGVALGFIATYLLKDHMAVALILGLGTAAGFVYMMMFLLPFIFATFYCIFHDLPFKSALERSLADCGGRTFGMALTLIACSLPAITVNIAFILWNRPGWELLPMTLISLLSIPPFVLLYLIFTGFEEREPLPEAVSAT